MQVISIEYLRDRGFSDVALFPDSALVEAEARVWDKVETFCLQFFEKRIFSDTDSSADYPAMRLDGNNRNTLPLPVPIISLTSLTEDDTSIDLDEITVFNRYFPDDRRRPRIAYSDRAYRFNYGNQNVVLEGEFGFVEKDGSTPSDLVEAVMLMMLFELAPKVGKPGFKLPRQGLLIQENADKYLYKLQQGEVLNGVTGVPEIDKVLYKYKRSDDVLFGGVV